VPLKHGTAFQFFGGVKYGEMMYLKTQSTNFWLLAANQLIISATLPHTNNPLDGISKIIESIHRMVNIPYVDGISL